MRATLVSLFCAALLSVRPAPSPAVRFTDVLSQTGITFRHASGASEEKYLIETMGAGCGLIDYDQDGWLDIYFVNGGPTRMFHPEKPLRNALYRNNHDGTFTDVTERAGVPGNGAYGMGVAVGDYDRDGYPDLFITNFGPNQLYHNNGDGTFTDATARAGVGDPRWGTSAAWLDFDGDGWLDLYVANYLDFTYDKNPYCGERTAGRRGYCHPDHYNGVPNLLYRNNHDGTFTEVGKKAGIVLDDSKGLGVVAGDFNGDGRIDLYVANDSVRNFLFRNNGDGTFSEIGVVSGAAYDENGKAQAGMGTDMADYDGDGRPDLLVTNLDTEYNTLYRNLGRDLFQDVTVAAGLGGEISTFDVGFGTGFVDYDNDGWKDIFVANGHILDNIALSKPQMRYAQPKLLYRNLGNGTFADVTATAGAALSVPHVSRGAAFGDLDNDGDIDVVVSGCNAVPQILRNDGGNAANSLALRFEGVASNRDGIGVAVRYVLAGRTVYDQRTGGGSYLSASDTRLHLGLGQAREVRQVEIRWPSGAVDRIEALAAGFIYTIKERSGVSARAAFTRR
ncbi:MAG: hypothetical protein DMG07_06290 [Acidobacteria bacterium]|nr:MAG: hypothetical protein DMG07_06290 [Acidobacteriota bacterium]